PGLDPDRCACGVHALDAKTGRTLGSLVWPTGNQVFAVEAVPSAWTAGLPIVLGRRRSEWERGLFYGFVTEQETQRHGPGLSRADARRAVRERRQQHRSGST